MIRIADPIEVEKAAVAQPKKGGFRRIFWWIIAIAIGLFIGYQFL